MTRVFALIAVLAVVSGCASVDYGGRRIDTKPSAAGCAVPNSPCAHGGKGL